MLFTGIALCGLILPYSRRQGCRQNNRKSAVLAAFPDPALVFSHPIRFHCWLPVPDRF
jgi:hypothetical protein